MAIATNVQTPGFLYGALASDGQYVDVSAVAASVTLANVGCYVLTSMGVEISFALGATALDGTNGHHIPANDTRVIYVDTANTVLRYRSPTGATSATGKMNISRVQAAPERV